MPSGSHMSHPFVKLQMSVVVQTSTLERKEALLETHPLFQAHIPCCLVTLDFNSAVGVTCDFDIILSSSDPNSGTQWALHQFQFNKPSHLPLCKLFLFTF